MSRCTLCHHLLGAAVTIALSLTCQTASTETLDCSITTRRPAMTFLIDDAVSFQIDASCQAQDVTWTVTDIDGTVRATGVVRVGAGSPATLRVRERLGVGYYHLSLEADDSSTAHTPMCVLPPPDVGCGQRGLFGVSYRMSSERHWEVLSQAGVRQLRAEFTWPEIEREEGTYDFSRLNWYLECAQTYNMQLTVLTGHTPLHHSERPVDAEGRVQSAWYTWQPRDPVHWYSFMDAMARRMLGHHLDAREPHSTDTLGRGQPPLVLAWEVWSEADQNFYYGDWGRYLDMLRIAYCTLRSYERVPVVYGSCGHWTEMAYTVHASCENYFDRIAYHPNGNDPEYALIHWWRNMPQVLVGQGAPRATCCSECYIQSEDPADESGFILKLYTVLKSFRQRHYIRSGCLGAVISSSQTPRAMLWSDDGTLTPRPPYVAFALTRWLLEDARYVGPLTGQENVHCDVMIRDGVPMLVAWAEDGTATMRLDVAANAMTLDALGRTQRLSGPTARLSLTEQPIAVLGISFDYVREAAIAGTERWLTTELGHESPHNSGYIDPLEEDAAKVISAQFPEQVRDAVVEACDRHGRRASQGAAAFFAAQRVVGEGMLTAALNARRDEQLTRRHTNTIWRLAQLTEDLGEIADGLGERWWRMNNVSPADMEKTRSRIDEIRRRVAVAHAGAECPFADRLLDRAEEQLRTVSLSGGHRRGAWWTATLHTRAAHALTGIERPEMRRVFAVVVFPEADAVTKGVLLPPSSEQEMTVRVYNFLDRSRSGLLTTDLPEQWSATQTAATFNAPAGGVSAPVRLDLAIPEEPRPWVAKVAHRPWNEELVVDLPQPLPANEVMYISGDTGSGVELLPMRYRLLTGSYPSQSDEAQATMFPFASVQGDRTADRITRATDVIAPSLSARLR